MIEQKTFPPKRRGILLGCPKGKPRKRRKMYTVVRKGSKMPVSAASAV